jgi:hypothetical protein
VCAKRLVRLFAAGELSFAFVPSETDERFRDLVRSALSLLAVGIQCRFEGALCQREDRLANRASIA